MPSPLQGAMQTIPQLVGPVYDVAAAYLRHVVQRMDIPAWDVYSTAFQTCAHDLVQSSQSTATFLYLTFRPVAILCWIILEILGRVGQVLFQHLLAQGWRSAQNGAMQAKAGIVWFYMFQRSLSRTEALGEIAICCALVVGYYLRKWLKRQTYVERASRWCSRKKRYMVQQYTRTVNRIAKFSLLLAMLTPHAAFWGAAALCKIMLPRVLRWLAMDTYATVLISVAFPMISTIGWIHAQRNPGLETHEAKKNAKSASNANGVVGSNQVAAVDKRNAKESSPRKAPSRIATRSSARIAEAKSKRAASASYSLSSSSSSERKSKDLPAYMKTTKAQQSREETTRSRTSARKKLDVFPRTSPSKKRRGDSSKDSSNQAVASAQSQPPIIPMDSGSYWLRYWIVYASFQLLGRSIMLVPIFGRMVTRHTMLVTLTSEFRLFFFIWIFTMERTLRQNFDTSDGFVAQALPLQLLLQRIQPIVTSFHEQVSQAVSVETWESMAVSRAKQVLGALVLIRFISEDRKAWLIHLIEEGRVLVIPSITLMMPGFVTQFGVMYVQFLLPAAKSINNYENDSTDGKQLHLEYWTLNIIIAGFLQWFSSLLWWIPFSTHAIFILWCYLTLPKTITQLYDIFELELVAFGLIAKPGHESMDINDTRTMRLVKVVAARLPSADASDNSKDDQEGPAVGDHDSRGGGSVSDNDSVYNDGDDKSNEPTAQAKPLIDDGTQEQKQASGQAQSQPQSATATDPTAPTTTITINKENNGAANAEVDESPGVCKKQGAWQNANPTQKRAQAAENGPEHESSSSSSGTATAKRGMGVLGDVSCN